MLFHNRMIALELVKVHTTFLTKLWISRYGPLTNKRLINNTDGTGVNLNIRNYYANTVGIIGESW